jgi:hypothetical protein
MEANELRIGNYVKGNSRGHTNVVNIEILEYINKTKSGYSPIPITEEWLIKFGFKVYRESVVIKAWSIGFNTITHDYLFDLCWIKDVFGENKEVPFYRNGRFKIHYVHQLQNLYFALTGEELEINL